MKSKQASESTEQLFSILFMNTVFWSTINFVFVQYNATEIKKTLDMTNQMKKRGLSLKKLSMLISTLKDVCLFVPTQMMKTSILSIESHLHGMLHGNYHLSKK